MDVEQLALLIPIMALAIPFFAIWLRHREKMMDKQTRLAAEKAAQYATSNTALEERIRVLERIVTDQGYDVARQIEALRDIRSVASSRDEDVPPVN